jgi:hypothetical protein
MGYSFTPNKAITVNALGGFFNGTKTVSLFKRSNGALLASTTVTGTNNWAYSNITPVTLTAGTSYSVAVWLNGSGGSYYSATMPTSNADSSIDGSCYSSSATAEPCASSGLISSYMYGVADIRYTKVANTTQGQIVATSNFVATSGACYTDNINAVNTGSTPLIKCVELQNNTIAANQPVILDNCNGGASQTWTMVSGANPNTYQYQLTENPAYCINIGGYWNEMQEYSAWYGVLEPCTGVAQQQFATVYNPPQPACTTTTVPDSAWATTPNSGTMTISGGAAQVVQTGTNPVIYTMTIGRW